MRSILKFLGKAIVVIVKALLLMSSIIGIYDIYEERVKNEENN